MTTPTPLTGARAKALVAYIGISGLFILGVWLAFILAGSGVFGLNHQNLSTVHHHLDDQKVLDPHKAVGSILGLLAAVQMLVSFGARPGKRIVIGSVVLFVLAFGAQMGLAHAGNHIAAGFHVLDAGIILVLSFLAASVVAQGAARLTCRC